MAILRDSDLFDFDSYRRQLADTGAAALDLAQSTEASATRMKSAYAGTINQLELIQRTLQNTSASSSQQAAGLFQKYGQQVDKLANDAERYKSLLKQLEDQQNASGLSIKEMTTLLAGLEREYKSLKPDQADFAAKQGEIAQKLRAVSTVLNAQNAVLREAKRATDAAEGSYQQLSQETNELRQALRQMPDAFDRTTGAINRNNHAALEMQHIIERNDRVLRTADASMGQHQRNVGNYGSALRGMGSQALMAAGTLIGVSSAFEAIQAGFGIISDMERVDSALRAVSKDTADFNQTQQFLIATADQLGLRYDVLARSYKGLKAATNGTALEGKATEQIFTGMVRAGAALKLSNEEIEGALRAVEQMMSKGKITAEELRGQLGERLPGAMKLMAEATGISEAKLNKMMEQGELLAVDVLPKLANQLDKTYGKNAQNNLESMSGGWNRMTNEVHLFLAALNEDGAVSRMTNNITNMFAETIKGLRAAVQSSDWKTFFGALASYSGMGMVLPGIGSGAREQVAINARTEATVNQYRAMPIEQRQARRGITEDAIARDEKLLKTTYKDSVIGGDKTKVEARINENKQLLEKLNKVETEVRRKNRRDNEQEEINAQRAAATKKEALADKNAKDAAKQETARKKAQTEADRKLTESLSTSKAGTDVSLAQNNNDRTDGLISEQQFIERRHDITVAGIEARESLLAKAGKKESDDYKRLQKEKIDAETAYQRDTLKLKLSDAKSTTAGAVADLGSQKSEGLISEAEYVEQKHAIVVGGLNEQLRILAEAGQAESQLARDVNTQLLTANRDYYKERIKVQRDAWKKELAETKAGFDEIDTAIGQEYADQLADLTTYYDERERKIQVGMALGSVKPSEGEAQLHAIRMERLEAEMDLTELMYRKDQRLSDEVVNQKIAALQLYKADATRTPAEIAEAENQITALKKAREKEAADDTKKLNKEVADNTKQRSDETTEHEIENAKKVAARREQLWQKGLELAETIGSALFDITSGNADRDLSVLDKQKERELSLAGENVDAKTRIEEQYAKRKAEIQRKQAIADRAQALFNIAINTAMGVASVLSTGGGTRFADFGISAGLLSAFVIATGAIQAAAVLAKPLPAFWQGTSAAPEGFAQLAERGPELRQRRDGSYKMYERPTVDYLEKGDRVYTASQTAKIAADWQRDEQTRQVMQEAALNEASTKRLQAGRLVELQLIHSAPGGSGLSPKEAEDAFGRALDKRPSQVTQIDDEGNLRKFLQHGHSRTEYLSKRQP